MRGGNMLRLVFHHWKVKPLRSLLPNITEHQLIDQLLITWLSNTKRELRRACLISNHCVPYCTCIAGAEMNYESLQCTLNLVHYRY